MNFSTKLVHGRLIKRYKRFLADVILDDGSTVTAHCTNSGSMKSCLEENAEVFLSPVDDPKRKTKHTWEMIKINNNWIGINTMMPNKLAYESIKNNIIPELKGYNIVKREVTFNDSRFDIYAENDFEKCFIEVKNVTMKVDRCALFPDAITTRGQKHLKTLMEVKEQGYRAVMLYIIQRIDVEAFGPAKDIDPEYATLLKKAYDFGVEILPYQALVEPTQINLGRKLPHSL